jgi:hypothetical protein
MDGHEHREIGDAAFGNGLVNLGGDPPEDQFWFGCGDVMALSGDYFQPDGTNLFSLSRIQGERGTRPGTRDELVCALRVMTVDEAFVDPRFGPGGRFADFGSDGLTSAGRVERQVRDRYLHLAATNDDHFARPGGVTHERLSDPFGSAPPCLSPLPRSRAGRGFSARPCSR